MRSRHNRTRRARISPLDRVIQTSAGSAIVAVVKSNVKSNRNRQSHPKLQLEDDRPSQQSALESATASPNAVSLAPNPPKPKRKNPIKRAIHRLQYPVGWWPVIVLIITWMMMLVIIWRSFQEIVSLGALPTKQSIVQLERKALLEFLAALCLGGIGLSLALTPALKRTPRGPDEPLPASLESSRSDES